MLYFLRMAMAGSAGLALYFGAFQGPVYYQITKLKLEGKGPECPWSEALAMPRASARFAELREQHEATTHAGASDAALGIVQVATGGRSFWVKQGGTEMSGAKLIPYLLTEHEWIQERNPGVRVDRGDVVVDIGAHVGVFTDNALRAGASKVIMVEPDPINVECLRRNFATELANGRVVLIAEGAWSSHSELELHIGVSNSGTGSMQYAEKGSRSVKVPVRPLDEMLAEKGITQVNFIKMDIEGAEREALRGASKLLAAARPKLMLDSYHLPDDPVVLPKLINQLNAKYEALCGPCELNDNLNRGAQLTPHVTFYR
jgi:FkbM family methyltransferase